MSQRIEEINHGKITKFNVPKGCCAELSCSTHASYYYNVQVADMKIQLVFCKSHYEEFQKQMGAQP